MGIMYFDPVEVDSFAEFVRTFSVSDVEVVEAYRSEGYESNIVEEYNKSNDEEDIDSIEELEDDEIVEVLVENVLLGYEYGLMTSILAERNAIYIAVTHDSIDDEAPYRFKKLSVE